jgi:hypothetical protein
MGLEQTHKSKIFCRSCFIRKTIVKQFYYSGSGFFHGTAVPADFSQRDRTVRGFP